MSSEDPTPVTDSTATRQAVRDKAAKVQQQLTRKRRIRTLIWSFAGVLVVAGIGVGIFAAFQSNQLKPSSTPSNMINDGFEVTSVSGVVTSTARGSDQSSEAATATESSTPAVEPVDIKIYVDYLSPTARDFDAANGAQLASWVRDGSVKLSYYPVATLTGKTNANRYSLRAAAAATCVSTHSPKSFLAYHVALLREQPGQDGGDLSDRELADLALATGAEFPNTVRSCIEEGDYLSWVKEATDRALVSIPANETLSLTAVPTILVEGNLYTGSLTNSIEFSQYLLKVASDKYYLPENLPSPVPSAGNQ